MKAFRIKIRINNFAYLKLGDEENIRVSEKELKIRRVGVNLRGVLRGIYREIRNRTKMLEFSFKWGQNIIF